MITISGRVPSKKNGKVMICRGNKPLIISNAKFQAWEHEQLILLKDYKNKKQIPSVITTMTLSFYFPDNRRTDLTNKAESIMDLFVDAGLIEDDNWEVIPKLVLESKGVDKKNPRVEISFY